jgi:hypothetical protein
MVAGFRTMLAAAPHTAAALHLVELKISHSHPPVDISTHASNDSPKRSNGMVSRTKSTAKVLFYQCTANFFRRNKAELVTIDESRSDTPTPSMFERLLAPNPETPGATDLVVSTVDNFGPISSPSHSVRAAVPFNRPGTPSTTSTSPTSSEDKNTRVDKARL